MIKSEQIDQLVAALAKARLEFTEPEQDRTAKISSSRADYTYNYSSLPEILGSIYPALGTHGLALMTPTEERENGIVYALVTLYHETGQYIGSEYPMPQGLPPKEFGGMLKTVRRHLICSLLNISPTEEESPNQGSKGPRSQSAPKSAPAKPAPAAAAKPTADDSLTKPLTVQRINQAKKTYRLSNEDVKEILANNIYPEDVYQLDIEQTDNLIRWMEAEANLRAGAGQTPEAAYASN